MTVCERCGKPISATISRWLYCHGCKRDIRREVQAFASALLDAVKEHGHAGC